MESPVAGIFQIAGLDIRFYTWAIIGPQYLEMQKNMFRLVIVVNEWVNQVRLMKCP
jgi:hypothetical protein